MTTITFDSLRYVKILRAAGFEERQAEGLAEAHSYASQRSMEDVATKRDIKDVELEIEKVRREIVESKVEVIKWVAGLLLAQTGLLFTLVKLFPPH